MVYELINMIFDFSLHNSKILYVVKHEKTCPNNDNVKKFHL